MAHISTTIAVIGIDIGRNLFHVVACARSDRAAKLGTGLRIYRLVSSAWRLASAHII
jgi:hypothetical protein